MLAKLQVKSVVTNNLVKYADSTQLNKFETDLSIVNLERLLMIVMRPSHQTLPQST